MSRHLWELSSYYRRVEAAAHEEYSPSWADFLENKEWKRSYIYDSKPVHWNWCDITDKDFDGDESEDHLDLVWMSFWPCNVYVIHVYLKKDDEPDVISWMLKHKFLPETDV